MAQVHDGVIKHTAGQSVSTSRLIMQLYEIHFIGLAENQNYGYVISSLILLA